MSLPTLADPGPDPALLTQFAAPAGVPKAVHRRAEFFVFFAETVFPRLAQYRPVLAPFYHPPPIQWGLPVTCYWLTAMISKEQAAHVAPAPSRCHAICCPPAR